MTPKQTHEPDASPTTSTATSPTSDEPPIVPSDGCQRGRAAIEALAEGVESGQQRSARRSRTRGLTAGPKHIGTAESASGAQQ